MNIMCAANRIYGSNHVYTTDTGIEDGTCVIKGHVLVCYPSIIHLICPQVAGYHEGTLK